eukprot:9113933-Prorocentrum_lima.AAC.1
MNDESRNADGRDWQTRTPNVSDLASQTHQPTGTDGNNTDTFTVSSYAIPAFPRACKEKREETRCWG